MCLFADWQLISAESPHFFLAPPLCTEAVIADAPLVIGMAPPSIKFYQPGSVLPAFFCLLNAVVNDVGAFVAEVL